MLTAQETSNKAAVRRFCDAANTGDAARISNTIDELVAPDALIRTPLPIKATGAQLAKELFARLLAAYPDLRITIDQHRGAKPLERINLAPMGCHPSAIQSTGSSQEERTTADRREAGHVADRSGHNGCYRSPSQFLSHARLAADRDERIGPGEALVRDRSERQVRN